MPTSLKEEAIQLSHDIPSAAHQGVARSKARMKEKFYWYGMGKDIANYVTTCAICNRNKKHDKYGKTPMIEYQAGAPMDLLVGCFWFNGSLRQYFSLYRAVSQREGERGEKG